MQRPRPHLDDKARARAALSATTAMLLGHRVFKLCLVCGSAARQPLSQLL
jgi:hypothetical protein